MIRRLGALLGVLMVLILVGCETPDHRPGVENASAPAQANESGGTVTKVAPKKTAAVPPTLVTPPLNARDRDPTRLLHMSDERVSSLLGTPQFVRKEAAARVWQYREKGCVLDLFLYDVDAEYQVIFYEFRGSTIQGGPTENCFEQLILRAASIEKS
jgi:hypothetical protein